MFYKKPDLHGRLDKDGILIKKGKQVVLFENYDGFGVPIKVLEKIRGVEIHYKGKVYIATTDTFYNNGIEHTFQDPSNYRQEKQLILPRKFWDAPDQTRLI